MKNIQLTRRETDLKVLAVVTIVGCLALAGGFGWLIAPASYDENVQLPLINFVISFAIALFVWSTFNLMTPFRYSRNWQIAEFIAVPLIWLLLTVVVDTCLHYVIENDQFQMSGICSSIIN
jgi:hypothetical protein